MANLKERLLERFFKPGLVGLLLNPFYIARRGLYLELARLAPRVKGRLLDVGCGTKPYLELFKGCEYIGLEYSETGHSSPFKKADYFYSGDKFPFEDASFDALLSSQVMEHIFEPDIFLDEAYRCLKPGGDFILTVPFVWEEHEPPYDYARYSSFALDHLAKKHGFEIASHVKVGRTVCVLAQLLLGYILSAVPVKRFHVNYMLTAPFVFPVNLLALALTELLPGDDGLYLDNVLHLKKPK